MAGTDTEVAIVGAGPVGLFTALRLSRQGISCVLVEAEESLPEDLRASTFHPPTLDILDDYGLAAPLIEQGRVCPEWQIRYHETGERVVFDLSVLEGHTRHPYRLQCEQYRLCWLMLAVLQQEGKVDIRLGTRVLNVAQEDDRAELVLEDDKGQTSLTAKYVVGADGSRSVVRKVLDLSFEGKTYPETTILATTTFPFEDHLEGLSHIDYVWSRNGTFSLLHLPALWRCSLYAGADETIEEAAEPEAVQRKLQEIVPTADPYPIGEIRTYRIHMRIVEDYRKGRIVLAGDSAHLTSPSGGMGMNGGLHDAYFLVEALSAILKNGADDTALDHYTRRRRPVAHEQILIQADANRRRMQERDPERRREMFEGLLEITADRDKLESHLLRTSMIVGWRQSMEAK